MTRLQLIEKICRERHSFVGFVFEPTQEDIQDELVRLNTKPDKTEPNEETLLFMDEVFEGGQ